MGTTAVATQHRQKHKGDKDHRNKDRGDKYQGNQGGNSCGCNYPAPKPQGDYGQNKYQGNQGGNSCGCNYPAPKPESDYGQNKYQGNQGGTSCGCDYQGGQGYEPGNNQGDQPEVKQVNVNAPISILSIDSNNGDVRQSNDDSSSNLVERRDGTEERERSDLDPECRCEQRRRAPVERHRLVVEARLRLQPEELRLRRRLAGWRLVRRRWRQPDAADRWDPRRRRAPRRKLGWRFAARSVVTLGV